MSRSISSCRFLSHGEKDTEQLAKLLSDWIQPGSVIALDGDLGAGKTRFAQGFAKAIGVQQVVNSPTFTIIKEYRGDRLPFYHMDVYRISLQEADELGLDEYFYGEGITLVEWASLIEPILPPERMTIYIENGGGQERIFKLEPHGQPYESWCSKLKEIGAVT